MQYRRVFSKPSINQRQLCKEDNRWEDNRCKWVGSKRSRTINLSLTKRCKESSRTFSTTKRALANYRSILTNLMGISCQSNQSFKITASTQLVLTNHVSESLPTSTKWSCPRVEIHLKISNLSANWTQSPLNNFFKTLLVKVQTRLWCNLQRWIHQMLYLHANNRLIEKIILSSQAPVMLLQNYSIHLRK